MRPDDPRHGTNAGHRAHFTDGELPCQPCRDAHSTYHRKRRARLYLQKSDRLTVPNLGAVRRVRALQAIGWDLARIGREMGYEYDADQDVRVRVWNVIGRNDRVRIDVFERLCGAYGRLSGTPGPSGRARQLAERRGWAPPLAWDNIDDPDEQPYAAPKRTGGRPARAAAVVEEFDWLTGCGESPQTAADRLGVSLATVRDYRTLLARRAQEAS